MREQDCWMPFRSTSALRLLLSAENSFRKDNVYILHVTYQGRISTSGFCLEDAGPVALSCGSAEPIVRTKSSPGPFAERDGCFEVRMRLLAMSQ